MFDNAGAQAMRSNTQEWTKAALSTLLEFSVPGELLAAAYGF